MRSVAVFCGSSPGRQSDYHDAIVTLGRDLARRGLRVVYGGARVGTMGTLADAVLGAGGEIIGVIPRHLMRDEIAHDQLSELRVVTSMHERKAVMADLADAFITAPGGLGTLEEWAEITTWAQLGLHTKPVGLLNVAGYYDALLAFLDHALDEGFVSSTQRALVTARADPVALLDVLVG